MQVVGYKAGSVFAGGGLLAVIDVAGWGWMFALLACVYGGVALFVWGAPVLDGEPARGQGEGRRGSKDVMQPGRCGGSSCCARNAMDDALRTHYKLGKICVIIQHQID